MFNWLKKLFNTEESLYTQRESEGTIGIERPKITPTIEESKSEATQVRKTQSGKKKSEKETTIEQKKRGRKKSGVTKTDLNKMTKDELEDYAKKEYRVDIDKRKKKADLVNEVLSLSVKNG